MIRKTWKLTLALSLAFAFAACGDDDGGNNNTGMCGNGVIEGAEQCDMDQLGTTTCATIGGFTGGTLACSGTCTFDTSGCTNVNPDCGNGAIDDDEDCDGTNLNDQQCADVGNYTGGTLACSGTCAFDTSACIAAPACGNGVIEGTEVCDGTNLNGMDCEDVGNFEGGTLACSGTCTWNTAQCTAPITCGNGALDAGEDCDGALLNDNECGDLPGFLEGGTLACLGNCTFDTALCIPDPSAQIGIARAAADGNVSLPLTGVWVTYLKANEGTSDPAGFFVQVDATGPALFIAVDPTTLNPAPVVGDEVAFTITTMATAGSLRMATAISGYSRLSQGHDVSALTQNVSAAADLVSALGSYESELITVTGILTSGFTGLGNAHVGATMDSSGVTGSTSLKLRIPLTLQPALGLDVGCSFTVTRTPLWRYTTTAQVSAYHASEVTLNACPAPYVTGAAATDATELVVTFNREIDGASLDPTGAQFAFDNGLTATGARATGNAVTVTTSAQTPATIYTVTVASSLTDLLGTGVGAPNNRTFVGFGGGEVFCTDGLDDDGDGYVDCQDADCAASSDCAWGQQLYLWEVDADTPANPTNDNAEFIEIRNLSGAAVDFATAKYYLLWLNGGSSTPTYVVYRAVQLTGSLADGDIRVLGNAGVNGVVETWPANTLQNGADGVLLVRCDTCTATSTDFPNDFDVTTSATFTTGGGKTATKIDAIAYDTNDDDNAALMGRLGVTVQWNEGENNASETQSLHRVSPTTWVVGAPTPGVSNQQ